MEITDFVINPASVIANGSDKINVSAVIINGANYVSGTPVVFTIVDGNAVFENGLNTITVKSNTLGVVSTYLVDTQAETIILEIALEEEPATHKSLLATFTQSDGTVDRIALALVIDGAKADGNDTNQVELQTFSGNVPAGNVPVSVTLSNGAVFINQENKANITTDGNGRSSLPFTSTTAGESTLRAYLDSNIAVFNSVKSTFTSTITELSLVLEVVSDDAQANGNAVNRVCATVRDNTTKNPIPDQTVRFDITRGSATFPDESTSYTAITDSEGKAYASLKDLVMEAVTVTAAADNKSATVTVHFTQKLKPLKISRVYNVNNDFTPGEPTTAWKNAEFTLEATGGSGEYTWSVSSQNIFVSSQPNTSYMANVLFVATEPEYGAYTITVTDKVTHEQDTYTFNLETYFTHYADPKFYAEMLLIGFGNCPSTNQLSSLHKQWGNMSKYGWILSQNWGWYWTSNSNILTQERIRLIDGEITSGLEQIIACCYSTVYRGN